MLCLWSVNNAAEKKVKTFFLSDANAWSDSPHTTLSNSWAKFFGQKSVPSNLRRRRPAFIVTLRSSHTLQKPPRFQIFPKCSRILQTAVLFTPPLLPRLSLLSKSGCYACDGGRMAQQFAGGAGNEASCFLTGLLLWDHRDDRSRWRCVLA